MSMTDPIADLLTRIRNGLLAKHGGVEVPSSRIKTAIVRILKEEGYIEDFELNDTGHQGTIHVSLKYGPRGPAISGIERVSRPGRRVYRGKRDLPKVLGGLGITIVSTPKGIMTGTSCRGADVGGEVLCAVW